VTEQQRWWYLGVCGACDMTVPFRDEGRRDEWADAHETTGHQVLRVKAVDQ
jgi:hypothetical protein